MHEPPKMMQPAQIVGEETVNRYGIIYILAYTIKVYSIRFYSNTFNLIACRWQRRVRKRATLSDESAVELTMNSTAKGMHRTRRQFATNRHKQRRHASQLPHAPRIAQVSCAASNPFASSGEITVGIAGFASS